MRSRTKSALSNVLALTLLLIYGTTAVAGDTVCCPTPTAPSTATPTPLSDQIMQPSEEYAPSPAMERALANVTPAQNIAPGMIGDFFGGFAASGVQIGGVGGMGTTSLGFFNALGDQAFELINIDLTTNAPLGTFQSVGIAEPFLTVNPLSAATTDTTILALQPNGQLIAAAPAGATFQSSQAVPVSLINQVPGLAGAILGDPAQFNPAADGVIVPPGGGIFYLGGNFPGSVAGQDLVIAGGNPIVDNVTSYLILNTFSGLAGPGAGLLIFAPHPGDSVGGYKIADNNSPMPRDRVYYSYNHFQHVFGRTNIDRSTFGIEKTFFNGRLSAEVRIPFASTVDTSQPSDGNVPEDAVFGNVVTILKYLAYRGESLLISAGVGFGAPTADDTTVTAGGAEIVRIRNESVHMLPFVAALWAPQCSRFFAQSFIQGDFDLNGNPVAVNFGGPASGRIDNTNFFHASAGVGYYLYEDDYSVVRRVAPMAEVHYNRSLEDGDNFVSNGLLVGSSFGTVEVTNLMLGGSVQIGNNAEVRAGWITPLNGDSDQKFNWEATAQVNIRFGRTSR